MTKRTDQEKANNLLLNLSKLYGSIYSSKQMKSLLKEAINNSGLDCKEVLLTKVFKNINEGVNQYLVLENLILEIKQMYCGEDSNIN